MKKNVKTELAKRSDYIITDHHADAIELIEYDFMEKQYDEQGNLIHEITYNQSGDISEMYKYQYDNEGRIVEKQVFFDMDEVAETIVNQYNKGNNPIKTIVSYADGGSDEIVYDYDDKENLILKQVVNEDGEIEEEERSVYEDNKLIEYKLIEYGDIAMREQRIYNESGQLIKIITWDGHTDDTVTTQIKYDEDGKRKEFIQYGNKNQILSRTTIEEYHNNQPLLVTEETATGKTITRYTYDDENNNTLHVESLEDGTVINEIKRTFLPEGLIAETEVEINRLGNGINQHYIITHFYTYF